MEKLRQKFFKKYAYFQLNSVRSIMDKIDWNNRLIGIRGSRGVGKTTLILQYIKQNYKPDNKVLYVSLDDLFFAENQFYDLAEEFYKKGGELLAVDEVHSYSNWSAEIKNVYDDMPNLKVIFTGSSLLQLRNAKADLSRRAVIYQMPGLSFREFIRFETNKEFPILSLEELLNNHSEIAISHLAAYKPLAYFSHYLDYGYYPFYLENKESFHQKLSEIILTVLEVDIPKSANIPISNITYLKKLLAIISRSVPYKPNLNSLSQRTGISLNTLKVYIKLLWDAEIINLLGVEDKGTNSISKPEKIYLNNSNLMYNLADSQSDIGNIRETFFYNQISRYYKVDVSKNSDFQVNKYTFEIGEKSKTKKQIAGIPNSFVIKDNIEIGSGNIIPLWMFGLLY